MIQQNIMIFFYFNGHEINFLSLKKSHVLWKPTPGMSMFRTLHAAQAHSMSTLCTSMLSTVHFTSEIIAACQLPIATNRGVYDSQLFEELYSNLKLVEVKIFRKFMYFFLVRKKV
jgi:hypothetical protein